MTNFEILGLLDETLSNLNKYQSFIAQLDSLAQQHEIISDVLADIAIFDAHQPSHLSRLSGELNAAREYLHNFSSREFFDATTRITNILRRFFDRASDGRLWETSLLKELNSLQHAYDIYLSRHEQGKIIPLIKHVRGFVQNLETFQEYGNLVRVMLTSNQESLPDTGKFALFMPAYLTFDEFIIRLEAIREIYDELCQILNVSTSDQPLRIQKIESGSLWASLFGNSKVMALMDDLIRGAAKYIHRTYTKEGKISTIPAALKSMDEILSFSEKLKESGVDVTEIQEQLAKGAVLIAKDMNALFDRQSSVVVNGEAIALSNVKDPRALEFQRILQLQNNLPDVKPD